MYNQSILPDELKSFQWYVDKLPLFLKNSEGFVEHFRIWYDILIGTNNNEGICNCGDIILYLVNIFNNDYLNTINSLEGNEGGTKSDILDKIGLLFGVKRNFGCKYWDDIEGDYVIDQLSLNNEDFLTLIKCQIINNYCEGSYSQIKEYYESAGLYVYVITYTGSTIGAECHNYLATIEDVTSYSDDLKKMFLAGMLTIDSVGIKYINRIISLTGMLVWDNVANGWDGGLWAI